MTASRRRPRVLILRALGLGDAVTAIPALRGVRRRWPTAELTIACPEPIGTWLSHRGLVDDVLPTAGLQHLAWPGPPPEIVVNLHGSGPESHRLLRALEPQAVVAFRCPQAGVRHGPLWRDDEHEVDRWLRLVNAGGVVADAADLRLRPRGRTLRRRGPVLIHPGAAAPSRRWPASRWARIATALAWDDDVIVTGVAAEADVCAVVADDPRVANRCGSDDLESLTELVERARLVLSGDTGVAHLATALGTPSVTLFGPVSPALWGPAIDADLHRSLWPGDAPDRRAGSRRPAPSLRPGDPHGSDVDPRLERIGVADVIEAILELGPVPRPGVRR